MSVTGRNTEVIRQQVGGSAWEYATRPPAPELRPYLRSMSGYVERAAGPVIRREMPGPSVIVILELGPPIQVFAPGDLIRSTRYPGGFVAGLDDTFTLTEHAGYQRGVQLDLTPIGARLLFGLPMSELTSRAVAFADVVPAAHRALVEQLDELPGWDARFDLIERVLRERVATPPPRLGVVAWACRQIEARGGVLAIDGLARELGYSQKHVIGLFREHVGVPPKLLARIVRFDRLIRRVRGGDRGSWADLAVDLGYYNQAHLARDVRQFAGATPTELRALLGVDLPPTPTPESSPTTPSWSDSPARR